MNGSINTLVCPDWFARGTEPLPILIITTDSILGHRQRLPRPIWGMPAPTSGDHGAERHDWLQTGPPRGLFGAGRISVRTSRLVRSTAGWRPPSKGSSLTSTSESDELRRESSASHILLMPSLTRMSHDSSRVAPEWLFRGRRRLPIRRDAADAA